LRLETGISQMRGIGTVRGADVMAK